MSESTLGSYNSQAEECTSVYTSLLKQQNVPAISFIATELQKQERVKASQIENTKERKGKKEIGSRENKMRDHIKPRLLI